MWGMENIVSLPLLEDLSQYADSGMPYVLAHPKSLVAGRLNDLADKVIAELERLSKETKTQRLEYDAADNAIVYDGVPVKSREVRLDCRCAACVEEFTGRALLDPKTVPSDVRPLNLAPIGRYATSIDWSDGHKSLVPFKQLSKFKDLVPAQSTSVN
jgi:DUF971 family protein